MKRRKGLLDEEKFLPPLPEQLPRGVSSLPGYGQTSPIAQGLLGFTGRQPTYSVMDTEAQKMSEAYRLGEQASVASQLYGSVAPFAVASTMANAQRAGSLLSPLTVFHGSPHKFSKFDASKIGTGEGAQVYGHGLYFAENPSVGRSYIKPPDDWAAQANVKNSSYRKAQSDILRAGRELRKQFPALIAKDEISPFLYAEQNKSLFPKETVAKIENLRKAEEKAYKEFSSGYFYTADLPDEEIAKMLDWDKPLSQQNDYVQKAIRSQMPDKSWEQMKGRTGRDYYEFYWGGSPHGASASGHLTELGIPGIRYLDEGSRAAKKGTSNFVVFPGEESKLRIMEVNGRPVVIDEEELMRSGLLGQ